MQDIILHLGAHRTGSTYVQGVLGKNAALLAAAGFGAPDQDSTRATLTERLNTRFPMMPLRGGFARFIADRGLGGAKRLIISDENMLGLLNDIFSHHAFYPHTNARLQRLKRLLPQAPRKVLLAIRPYETFFPSAYGRWLSPGRPVLPRAAVRDIVLGLSRGWADITADIAAVFPDAELVITEYHPDAGFGRDQLAQLLGPMAGRLKFTTGYRWNRGMSGYQTHRYEQALTHGHHRGDSPETIRQLIRLGQPPLAESFWDDPTRDALKRRYAADRARIGKQFPAFVTAKAPPRQDAP